MIESGALPLTLRGRFQPWAVEETRSVVQFRGFLGDPEAVELPRIFDVVFRGVARISTAKRLDGLRLTIAPEGSIVGSIYQVDSHIPGVR